ACAVVQHAHVAGPVTDERKVFACHMGYNDFARCASRLRIPVSVYDFYNDVLCGDVHPACRTLMSDQAGVTAAVNVRYGATERAHYLIPLFWILALGGSEHNQYANVV